MSASVLRYYYEVLNLSGRAGSSAGGSCLYISGVPGTGKTATCLEVVRRMQADVKAGSAQAFRFVEINGLRLPSPHHAYSRLYEALTGHHVAPARASELLEAHFSRARNSKVSTHGTSLQDNDSCINDEHCQILPHK
eukprot:scaffold333493_cov36-Prasinocladus_malaysianus.AAC.1